MFNYFIGGQRRGGTWQYADYCHFPWDTGGLAGLSSPSHSTDDARPHPTVVQQVHVQCIFEIFYGTAHGKHILYIRRICLFSTVFVY